MRIFFAFICISSLIVFMLGTKGFGLLGGIILTMFLIDFSPKILLLRQFILFLPLFESITMFFLKEVDGSLVLFFCFCGLLVQLSRQQKDYRKVFLSSLNKIKQEWKENLDEAQNDWLWLASSDFYFYSLAILVCWLVIVAISLLYFRFFDNNAILSEYTTLKAFAYVGIGITVANSFFQKLHVTLKIIKDFFIKDADAQNWLEEKVKDLELQGKVERITFTTNEEKQLYFDSLGELIFLQNFDPPIRKFTDSLLQWSTFLLAIFCLYYLHWYESLLFCFLLYRLPFFVGFMLPTVYSDFWFDFFDERLRARQLALSKKSGNDCAIEATQFILKQMHLYRCYINAPSLAPFLSGGKEPIW